MAETYKDILSSLGIPADASGFGQWVEETRRFFDAPHPVGREELIRLAFWYQPWRYRITRGIRVLEAMVQAKICQTNSEARRLIKGGGVRFNGIKVTDPRLGITFIDDKWAVFKVGKRYVMIMPGR